jgi:peroxiredoxin
LPELTVMQSRADRYSETMIVRARGRLLGRALAVLFAAAILAQLIHAAVARDFTEAPDFALKSTTGDNFRLSEYRSEVVAIVFWASWCGACREQLPALERLQQALAADGLRVLSVNFDDKPAAAREAAQAAGVSFPVLMDPAGEAGRLYDVGKLPQVVVVDRNGRLRASYSGAASGQAMAREIRAVLTE